MNFQHLKRRVERGEALVEGRAEQTRQSHGRMTRRWREAWTPLRIVVGGLASGFVVGRAEPEKALKKLGSLGGPRALQLVTSVVGLVGSVQAAMAAMTAKGAAETADEAADTADDALGTAAGVDAGTATPAAAPAASPAGVHHADRRQPDPVWDRQPSPAEAATELSER
ncbi:protein sip-5 [Luteimonas sp. MJ293]|uniref:protein sip-5 n=1 Tax=Luteimonas sp. MJ146 TaxID=3129240 RepID=UPI0031BA45E6